MEISFYAAGEHLRIDKERGIIHGVCMITQGVVAKGHELETDDVTLAQMLDCSKKKGKIPVKADHKSGIKETTGYLTNFHLDDNTPRKLRADWHLLKSFAQREQFLEMAEVMPDCFGLSVVFSAPDKPEKGANGRVKARCLEMMATDCVTRPAANPGGMFDELVDNNGKNQMSATPPPAEPTLKDVMAALTGLSDRVAAQDARLELMNDPRSPEDKLADLEQRSDADLAKLGLTRADIAEARAEIAAALADPEAQAAAQAEADAAAAAAAGKGAGARDGKGGAATAAAAAGAGAGAGAGTGAAATAALEDLRGKVTYLEQYMKGETPEQERAAIETAFEALETKVTALSSENEALRVALGKRTTTRIKPGVGEVHFADGTNKNSTSFEQKVEAYKKAGKTPGEATMLAQKEDKEGYQQYLVRLGVLKPETTL